MVLPPCLSQSSARAPEGASRRGGEPMGRILAVMGAIAATIWGAGSISAEPHKPSDPSSEIVIPVQVHAGFLIVAKGQIDSLSGLNFLIDTGQTYTSVDRSIVDKLGLDVSSSGSASILNLDKKVPAHFCSLGKIGMA